MNHHERYMAITVDSGAAENVMPEHLAPSTPLEYSEEQGTVYTAANGDEMPNRGKKRVQIITKEGQNRLVNMQITDVKRALMSVAKVCDAGHTVTFTKYGGVIENNQSGEKTTFKRENNVYRMRVRLSEEQELEADAGFKRQG